MKTLFKSILILFTCLFLSNTVFAESGPVELLQSLADNMIAQLKAHKATLHTNKSLVYSISNKIVVPHAALDEMAKRVLPAQTWEKATADQKSRFKKEFTTVLERTYASGLAQYTDETVKFFPLRGSAGNIVTVRSQIIRSDGPSIGVNYTLIRSGSEWRLLDIIVEGVSMLESFRSQFSEALAKGDMNNLITVLHNHNVGNDSD